MRILSIPLASILLALALGTPALAQDNFTARHEGAKPAVSGLNAKIDLGWVWTDGKATGIPGLSANTRSNAFAGQAAVSLPITGTLGLQIDAGFSTGRQDVAGARSSITSAGAGAHLFWRDPDKALFGFYGHYIHSSAGTVSASTWRYGAEAELYLGKVSLEGFVGADSYTIKSPILPSASRTRLAVNARLAVYPVDNLRLDIGVEHAFSRTSITGGAEWMMDTGRTVAPALYARASHDGKASTVNAGLKLYFGNSAKSLKARHREDDPQVNLLGSIGGLKTEIRSALASDMDFPSPGGVGGLLAVPLF